MTFTMGGGTVISIGTENINGNRNDNVNIMYPDMADREVDTTGCKYLTIVL